jgi:hypothetical protein
VAEDLDPDEPEWTGGSAKPVRDDGKRPHADSLDLDSVVSAGPAEVDVLKEAEDALGRVSGSSNSGAFRESSAEAAAGPISTHHASGQDRQMSAESGAGPVMQHPGQRKVVTTEPQAIPVPAQAAAPAETPTAEEFRMSPAAERLQTRLLTVDKKLDSLCEAVAGLTQSVGSSGASSSEAKLRDIFTSQSTGSASPPTPMGRKSANVRQNRKNA